ncbi:shikimate O-hydroxycinnamoyltransferase-like [Humulus lupulus]|uniref:shikimate O-hydroxycinnamoyltransferase-like n=1 Tax=Humulus lupulus TaxID=3486 RepID=UPI002B4027FA|nr:shikimate O-hydroxycinnamoyltransferase-like [Humulus lupulus]
MDIKVKERTLVKPAEKTPRRSLWLSDLDLLYDEGRSACLYFYKNCSNVVDDGAGASKFFDSTLLKEALAKVLVPYYPVAGRLRRRHDDGRLEIDCNDEGVLFIVAEANVVIDDLGDFSTSPELPKLTPPSSDYSAGISSFPLLVLQVTYFKCGGVSISVGGEHIVFDGNSAFSFMNAWSEIARGQLNLSVRPVLDRTLLSHRDPPQIMFDHTNSYKLSTTTHNDPTIRSSDQTTTKCEDYNSNFKAILVKITRAQLNNLKSKAKEEGNTVNYSAFAILAGLIWKCMCIARALPVDQETKLFLSANGRSRLHPPLSSEYFGNAVIHTTVVAVAGDVQSKPLWYGVNLIYENLKRIDNEYIRSALDFLTVHPNSKWIPCDECRGSNLGIYSWANFSTSNADFGWGQPFHMGHCGILRNEGRVWILDDGVGGNLSVLISLVPEHVEVFQKVFYQSIETS